jgi:glycerate 2-kinase
VTAEALASLYAAVTRQLDGGRLVAESLGRHAVEGRSTAVLAAGKVALPMFRGLEAAVGPCARALLIAPEGEPFVARAGVERLVSDHPQPSSRSVAAARAARTFVGQLGARDRLLVLLSGGGSSLLAEPAPPLTLEEKRATVAAVARAGATIAELNTVRKHLSAIKGGQLALATTAAITVLALSDVVGDDPATIASGPFSPDPTTFAQALALVRRLAPRAPAAAVDRLARGAAGQEPETPKPDNSRFAEVEYRIVANPARVVTEARRLIEASGATSDLLSSNTEEEVSALAHAYAARARQALSSAGPLVLVGNGEPRITVTGAGRGGRCTHLALSMARALSGLDRVAFLAAGTDAQDGNAGATGAAIDGRTWQRALDAGLDPQGALDRCDSATVLQRLGALVQGEGTSNLLDLHLLSIG